VVSSMRKNSNVEFSVPVSEGEKARATDLRDRIKDFCEHIEKFNEFSEVLTESLDQITSGDQLIPIGALFKKYQYKLRAHFNNCVKSFSLVLVSYGKLYSESRTDQIRDVILSTFSEARTEFINLMSIMDDFDAESFVADAKASQQQINNYLEKVLVSARDEWISHIDKNILGKLKLASDFSLVKVTK
jgi:hypothetical protein